MYLDVFMIISMIIMYIIVMINSVKILLKDSLFCFICCFKVVLDCFVFLLKVFFMWLGMISLFFFGGIFIFWWFYIFVID